jgi:Right handed beta helix region
MAIVTLFFLVASPLVIGSTYYVNNAKGDDGNKGLSAENAFASIAQATQAAKTSDTIVLAKTDAPYYESLKLDNLGGTVAKPFIIEGNGAVISGYRKIKASEWKKVGEDVYFFATTVRSRGTAYFMNHGKRMAEKRGKTVEALVEEGYLYKDKKGFFFRCKKGTSIEEYDLSVTLARNGVSIYNSSYIVCRNLVSEYFANDGFSLHGDCRGVRFENVEARYCGDQGISIHEACGLVVHKAYLHHNKSGIVDVNISRSMYHGLLVEHNEYGVGFNGGFHSIEDSVIRNNTKVQVGAYSLAPKHLLGGSHNPLGTKTKVFMKNVVISGLRNRGVYMKSKAEIIMEHSIISNCRPAIYISHKDGYMHLTSSIIANTSTPIDSIADTFFREGNLYQAGQIRWKGTWYGPDKWDDFRKVAGHDQQSVMAPVKLAIDEDGKVEFKGRNALKGILKRVGPTQPVNVSRGLK